MTKPGERPHDDCWPAEDDELLYCLMYFSYATACVDEDAIAKIVSLSQESNATQGITGLLVFDNRFFIQWLEGPRERIKSLMSRIFQDPHHTHVIVLSEREDERERIFPDWAMEWVRADHIREVALTALDATRDVCKIEALRFLLAGLEFEPLAALTMH